MFKRFEHKVVESEEECDGVNIHDNIHDSDSSSSEDETKDIRRIRQWVTWNRLEVSFG